MRKLSLKRRRFFPFFTILFTVFLFIFGFLYIALSPTYYELAASGCKNYTSSLIYKSLLDLPEEDFNNLTEILRDDGKVESITLNSAKANRIRSKISSNINERFKDKNFASYSVPMGNLFNFPLLSGRGPSIPIRIVPLRSFEADILSEFSEAGINQTKHSVYILAKAKVRLISPFSGMEYEISNKVPLTETVIVGEVPALYAK